MMLMITFLWEVYFVRSWPCWLLKSESDFSELRCFGFRRLSLLWLKTPRRQLLVCLGRHLNQFDPVLLDTLLRHYTNIKTQCILTDS